MTDKAKVKMLLKALKYAIIVMASIQYQKDLSKEVEMLQEAVDKVSITKNKAKNSLKFWRGVPISKYKQ